MYKHEWKDMERRVGKEGTKRIEGGGKRREGKEGGKRNRGEGERGGRRGEDREEGEEG